MAVLKLFVLFTFKFQNAYHLDRRYKGLRQTLWSYISDWELHCQLLSLLYVQFKPIPSGMDLL